MTSEQAFEIIKTGVNVFLTGKAGTGKSTLIKNIIGMYKPVEVFIASTTGISAINIGGCTVHSGFEMFGDYSNMRPIKKSNFDWKQIKLIVIDEVSMLLPSYLDYIDLYLKKNTGNKEPFGSIQIILSGDLNQLLPVISDEDEIERHSVIYGGITVDKAKTFTHFTTIELTHVYRQSGELLKIINEVRDGNKSSIHLINQGIGNKTSTHIVPYNSMVDKKNIDELNKLNEKPYFFKATTTGIFNIKNIITPSELILKIGARVLITKNSNSLCNGDQGYVTGINDDGVWVMIDRLKRKVFIQKATWEQMKKGTNSPEGTFTQLPLKLGYAITIHKSQGMSIGDLCIHYTNTMSDRMLYVAISRATNMDTLYIKK